MRKPTNDQTKWMNEPRTTAMKESDIFFMNIPAWLFWKYVLSNYAFYSYSLYSPTLGGLFRVTIAITDTLFWRIHSNIIHYFFMSLFNTILDGNTYVNPRQATLHLSLAAAGKRYPDMIPRATTTPKKVFWQSKKQNKAKKIKNLHTTAGIRWWSPTQLLTSRRVA